MRWSSSIPVPGSELCPFSHLAISAPFIFKLCTVLSNPGNTVPASLQTFFSEWLHRIAPVQNRSIHFMKHMWPSVQLLWPTDIYL